MRRGTRTIRIDTLAVLVLLAASLWPDVSRAQSFPADASWLPLRCRGAVMTDIWRDQGGAHDERDLVGDPGSPAGLRAFDQRFLYLRLRLDSDPAPGGALRPFSWGYQLDTDGRNDTYEILLLVRGNDKLIALQRNSTTTVANSTSDPADDPPVVTYPFSTHGRTAVASGSSFGGNADYFIDVAVPWSDLAQVQLTPTTIALGWAGTSSTANSLSNGDLACHDGASGTPTLSGTAPEGITIVPAAGDADGDGFSDQKEIAAGTNPNDAQSFPATGEPDAPIIAGGAGCAVAPEAAPAGGALVLLMLSLAALAARRVRRERAAEISGEERLSLLAEWRGSPYEKNS